jgi:hypothetical protein
MSKDLSVTQQDYAKFLPAISTFFATYIGKQRHDPTYVDPARVPSELPHGVESLNFFNKTQGEFYYPWALYSAGHANLNLGKFDAKEDMVRNRTGDTFLLADSGGFQIGKGVWEGDWKDPLCPKAEKHRQAVLAWLDNISNYSMVLDIPTWSCKNPEVAKKIGIYSFNDAVKGTHYNNEYFIKKRRGIDDGGTKFLNVLQGQNHSEADTWYDEMKKYCDPKQYPGRHFNGWAMGGQNMADVHLMLHRLVHLIHDGLLEQGVHDWMHFLGTSKLEMGLVLTDIQRAVRQHHNPNFSISYDCASPFLATANGQMYTEIILEQTRNWTYKMQPSVDDKKYATDHRKFSDAAVQDGIFGKHFINSPITDALEVRDICVYKPGDLNKIGKEGRTSWDSFSYTLQMAHNVWMHIMAVQLANAEYDAGRAPPMLHLPHSGENAREIIDKIFSVKDRKKALQLIDNYKKTLWVQIVGGGEKRGWKTFNTDSTLKSQFDLEISSSKDSKKKIKPKVVKSDLFDL